MFYIELLNSLELFLSFFFFGLYRAVPAAYGSSQIRTEL